MKKYHVWVCVEEEDTENGTFDDVEYHKVETVPTIEEARYLSKVLSGEVLR